MDCPICKRPMTVRSKDTSRNTKTGTKYDRTYYRCTAHDTWGKIEIPQKQPELAATR